MSRQLTTIPLTLDLSDDDARALKNLTDAVQADKPDTDPRDPHNIIFAIGAACAARMLENGQMTAFYIHK